MNAVLNAVNNVVSLDMSVKQSTEAIIASDPIVAAIVTYMATIVHCGNYGYGYWESDKKHVWWVGGDADGGDGIDEIREKLAAIPGVTTVSVEGEVFPCSDEDDDEEYEDDEDSGIWVQIFG